MYVYIGLIAMDIAIYIYAYMHAFTAHIDIYACVFSATNINILQNYKHMSSAAKGPNMAKRLDRLNHSTEPCGEIERGLLH